ncbi:trypsin-like peptidase domain-containing protein [Lapillicoccus sp.]|uniref:S1C family serine protease n=1 Tax=Lapillicoccus sp. TaxID=1909287 RepID=UPI0032676EF6
MSETPPSPGSGGQHPLPPAWHEFGVPHGGAPEPPAYTPAMRERTQMGSLVTETATPADTGVEQTQQIPTQQTEQIPWWGAPQAEPAAPAPAAVADLLAHPAPTGEPYAHPWASDHVPGAVGAVGAVGAGARRLAGLAGLALVAALLGGGVVLAGQQLLDRGTSLGSAVPAPGPGSTSRPDGSIAKIAADALPSVVTIRIKTSQGEGTGSGFVIDKQGHILTNNHVVAAAGGSSQISVELNNGTTIPATVAGADTSYDLAVLKVASTDIPPLEFGASKDVVVGDGVIAVGAPLGLDATVTSGIVSALNRPVTPGDSNDQSYINAIQTDAAINPGNSGGPLLDMNGRVIGINSAIARIPGSDSTTGGSIGVGFAIPSDQAAKTAQQLITTGKAEHPALGVRVDRSYDGDGAKLATGGVQAGSAADQAGLKDGDIITEFEGKKVTDANALIVAIRARNVGDTVTMTVQRGTQTVNAKMTLQASSS